MATSSLPGHERGSPSEAAHAAGATVVVVGVSASGRCDETCVVVAGEIDFSNATEFDRSLRERLEALPDGASMLLDLSRVTLFSAAGLHVLERVAASARERAVTMRLGPISRPVGRVLEICEVNWNGQDRDAE